MKTEMKTSIIWMAVCCAILATLLMASCTPVATDEVEVAPSEEAEAIPEEEKEEAPALEEEAVVEEEEEAPPPEEEVVTEEEEEAAPPVPAPDTTPPSAVTGLGATDAYDGKVNLWWDRSTAEDFNCYNIYVSQSEIADTGDMEPVQQITDIATNTYQATGLEDGTAYYFAVTAVDKSDNENTQVASTSVTPTAMPRGTVDSEISVDVYKPDKAWAGTTLLRDNHNREAPRIIEVNMLGEIIWEYVVPRNMGPAGDVELLPDNHILFTATNGVYEIDRSGEIVWSYLTDKISHDADRLPNGNTIFVFGMYDQKSDAQVTEVNPDGEIVWEWYASDHFNESPYSTIDNEGWTHTNAVTRMANGNTLISPRNFGLLIEVDAEGEVVRTIGGGVIFNEKPITLRAHENVDPFSPHDPEALPNGNILMLSQYSPHRAIEMVPETGEVVWEYTVSDRDNWPVRDADRLPNGNTLITGAKQLIEVTAG